MFKETVFEWFAMTVFMVVMFLIFVLDLCFNWSNKYEAKGEDDGF
jgi:hypothetical protein